MKPDHRTTIEPRLTCKLLAGSVSVIAAFLALGALGAVASDNVPKSTRPNILFVFSDNHSCQSIGAYRKWLWNSPQLRSVYDAAAYAGVLAGPSAEWQRVLVPYQDTGETESAKDSFQLRQMPFQQKREE